MAKVHNGRKSDSWKPGMVANGSGMISKNQKRKDKRYSHSLSAFKSQDTPTKKSMLGPLTKFKENLNQSLNLPSLGKKENKLLSTSLPIKAGKKSTPSLKKNVKPIGILSNSNTPKSKGTKVTFNMDKNVDKFIDNEAEEGEEPVTDKVVKPYEKGSKLKQQLKRRMSMMDVEESEDEDSESDGSDDESVDSASAFVDVEASEGEETDSVDEESYDENSDDDFMNDDSDEEMSNDDQSAEEMESEEDEVENSEEDSEEESEDESEEEMAVANSSKVVATPHRRESMAAVPIKKEKAENTPLPNKVAVRPEPVTAQSKKVNVKIESTLQSKKVNLKTESEQKKVNVKAVPEPKKEKVEAEVPVKGKAQATVEKKHQSKEKIEEIVVGGTSPFVGFIRKISKQISIDDVKSALSKQIDAKKIVGLRLVKDRNVFVYLQDEDALDSLLNNIIHVNQNFKFIVYKARDSASEKKPKFVAFLPKVPLSTTNTELKDAIVKYVGADCVEAVRFRRVNKYLQTRNILVHFTDVESLQKMVHKGELQVGSVKVVIRAAVEATVDVPTYRVLVTSIPEKTTEAVLKKAIESQVGQNTVHIIQFSQKKSSFAFVTLKNAEAQKKTLEVGKNISVNGTKLEVIEFKPRLPVKKRAAPSEQAKQKKKNKTKKVKLAEGTASNALKPGKKNKVATAAQPNDASPKANVHKPHQTPSKGTVTQTNAKKEALNSSSQEVVTKTKKNKQFPKPGKGANANQEPPSPVKGPAPEKGANPKQRQRKSKKGAANAKPQSPSPVIKSVNGISPSSPKQKKKKNKNKQQQQPSPKPVNAKKQALVEKIASKKKNKKNSMRRDAS